MTLGRTPILGEAMRALKLGEIVESARRATVSVEGVRGGTGWVALANGVIATSLEVAGFAGEVTLGLSEGTTIGGRVVACDVAYGFALVLPEDAGGRAPLRRAMQPPKLGDPIFTVRRYPASELGLVPGIVACAERTVDGRAYWEASSGMGARSSGGPVFDAEGRVAGVIARSLPGESAALVVPITALERELAALDRPAAQLGDRSPIYRCPECREAFSPECDRCLACGVLLPHARGEVGAAGARRAVSEILVALGSVANRASLGRGVWRIEHRIPGGPAEATAIALRMEGDGSELVLCAPVARVPAQSYEAFYRLLLTLNDQTVGAFRLSITGDIVFLSICEPLTTGREREITRSAGELVKNADHFRKAFAETYGATPCFDVGVEAI